MLIFILHFVPILLFSMLIVHLVSRTKAGGRYLGPGSKTAIILLVALLFLRPLIISMWMIGPLWFSLFIALCILVQLIKKKQPSERLIGFMKTFLIALPFYLAGAILLFSLVTGVKCERLDREPSVYELFSYCTAGNLEIADKYTKNPYHCRNAFFNSDRSKIYSGFGAETNQHQQVLLGVDVDSGEVTEQIQSLSVFRGYCLPGSGTCIHLIPPRNTIRLWDERNRKVIKDFTFQKDRPRFLSVDTEKPLVYVTSDGEWVAVVDLEKKDIVQKIEFPTSSILTVTNTNKRVITNTPHFFRPWIMAWNKTTGEMQNIKFGIMRIPLNLGFSFHVAADPKRERVFVGASFEGAIYMIDLEEERQMWRKKMPVGIRGMTYDTKRDVLYAANFVNGYVYKIGAAGNRPEDLGRIYIGQRLRYISYEPDMDIILTASANGFLIIDPEPGRKSMPWASPSEDKENTSETIADKDENNVLENTSEEEEEVTE